MTVTVNLFDILRLAPNAQTSYRDAFQNAQVVLDRYEITATPGRVAHFMAQILHESGGLKVKFEDLNYSAQRLPKVWPTRFKPRGLLDPADYAHNPEKLANEVYGHRNGNNGGNDGFTYRGRGLLQLTGKANYEEAMTTLRKDDTGAPDFVAAPNEVLSKDWCVAVAASKWAATECNALADQDDITAITRAINGGLNGLKDRIDWSKRTKAVWH